MSVETPPFAEQNKTYGAEQTRRAIANLLARGSTIGSVAGGIVGATDMAITAGSGMHVIVSTGEGWVPGSTSATQSGYYSRNSSSTELSIATSDPSHPRIDRVSALVKDEAYSGGENLFTIAVETGTPTAGATLENLSGVAAAPTSSYTLGYVLVPTSASSIITADIKNIQELVTLGISPLRLTGNEPVNGQIAEVGSGTVTLPVPKPNTVVGAFNNGGASEVTVSSVTNGGGIYGDFIVAATTIKLLAYQHVLLLADGSSWLIIGGEPKRTQEYGAETSRTSGTEYEASATRPVFVVLSLLLHHEASAAVSVGGNRFGLYKNWNTEVLEVPCSFLVPPTVKWKVTITGSGTAASSYLTQ